MSAAASPSQTQDGVLPRTGFVLLALLTLFWGVNWPFMKWGLNEVRPWSMRSLCIVIGVIGLFTCGRLAGQRLDVPRQDRLPLALAALFNITGWNLCSAYGLTLMASGRAAIIAFTMPLWASLFAIPLLGERMTRAKLLGLMFGGAGLLLLVIGEFRTLERAPLGALLMFGAAMSWALGSVTVKRHRWTTQVFALTAWQMVIGGAPILLGWAVVEGFDVMQPGVTALSWRGVAGTLYAATIPMIFCHWGWTRLLQVFPASVAAIGTLLIPVVGVFSAALLIGESIGTTELVSLGLIIAALTVTLRPRRPRHSAG